MKTRLRSTLLLITCFAFVGCAETAPSANEDTGMAGSPADGPDCASDADCSPSAPKCTLAGRCRLQGECDVDADCPGDFKRCDPYHVCLECDVDADCPSERPACVAGYELGRYCAECHAGDSSLCAAGTWCATGFGSGGECEPANCTAAPTEPACVTCIRENADACLSHGGQCTELLVALEGCPDWSLDACSGIYPSAGACTPAGCYDRAAALDACLLACDAIAGVCN